MSINYTPRTWVTGEVVTAAYMNNEIGTPFTGVQAAWTSYTPVLTAATTNPVLGAGAAIVGRYNQVGKTITGDLTCVFGSATTFGSGAWSVTLPTNKINITGRYCTAGLMAHNNGGPLLAGVAYSGYDGGSTLSLFLPSTTAPTLSAVTATVPFTWAASPGAFFTVEFEYESA